METQISSISLVRLPNGGHYRFMVAVVGLAKENTVLSTRLSKQITALDTAIADEKAKAKVSQKSPLTDQIAALDALRDKLLVGYKYLVKAYTYLPSGTELESANRLDQHLTDRNIDQDSQLDDETGKLLIFNEDLETTYATDVENIHAGIFTSQLKTANDSLNELLMERDKADSKIVLAGLKKARKVSDEAYRTLIRKVTALAELEEDEEVISFITVLNQLIERYRQEITDGPDEDETPDEEPTDKPTEENPYETPGADGDDDGSDLPTVDDPGHTTPDDPDEGEEEENPGQPSIDDGGDGEDDRPVVQ